jgi:RNA polymerase sigma-70 factor (ECF subfamily)
MLAAFKELWQRSQQAGHESGTDTELADLMILARNHALGLLRARGRRATPEYHDDEWVAKADASSAHQAALAPAVRAALASLSLEDRRAVVLCVLDGFTPTEIAAAVGEPAEAIRKRIQAGLVQLSHRIA